MLRFERLRVWHEAIALFEAADRVPQAFPPSERFVLTDQFRRAALSVSSNIAEGAGRETSKEAQHFFTIAKGSVFEVVGILTVCRRQRLISVAPYEDIHDRVEDISKMLSGLKRFSGVTAEKPSSRLAARGSGLASG